MYTIQSPRAGERRGSNPRLTEPQSIALPLGYARHRSPLPDLNRRLPPYHGGTLPTELRGQALALFYRQIETFANLFFFYEGIAW